MTEAKTCQECAEPILGRGTKYCSERCQKRSARDKYLQETYGITLEEWEGLLEYQGGVCAICGRKPVGARVMVVDHEHNGGRSGKVRGLLCSVPCNLRLVAKHKTGDQLRRAADYLDNPPAVSYLGEERIAQGKPKPKRKPRRRRA